MRLRLLDLFCGAGGASMGYHRAGFEVVGVDNRPQKRYPFEFHLADALEYLAEHGHEYDVIHASPPCQGYSVTHSIWKGREYPMLIEPLREILIRIGRPYVIENVPGSPLCCPIMLCGAQFGLKVYRHRLFETSCLALSPPHVPHNDDTVGSGHGRSSKGFVSVTGHGGGRAWQDYGVRYADYARYAMGIPWMSKAELSQAIPPAYTEWIGRQIIERR